MRAQTPLIVTRGMKRAAHQLHELASGKRRCLLLVAGSGLGKSVFYRWACEKLAWPYPLEYYWEFIQDAETTSPDLGGSYTVSEAVAFAEKIGLVDVSTRDRATELLSKRFDYFIEEGSIFGPMLASWLEGLADQLGQPRPDALSLLQLRGISADDARPTRFPLLITGSVTDNPRSITLKIYDALRPDIARGRTYYRGLRVEESLRKLPVALLFDEVDTVSWEVVRTFQQICESTNTPFCLAGTEQLVGRLMRDPRLRPIATRVELRVSLGFVTAGDLQQAFPQYTSDVILAVWAASGKNWRVAAHIIQELEEVRRERPGGRIGKRAVAAVAQQVLAARAIPLDLEETSGEGSLPAAVGMPAHAKEATPIPVERRAMRATG